jgi:hypothetical protein
MTVLERFKEVTGKDIQSYFEEFSSFVLNNYQKIASYYLEGTYLNPDILNDLDRLESSMYEINNLFSIYEYQLSNSTTEIWEVLDVFEQTKITILSIINSIRWLRTIKRTTYSTMTTKDVILRQEQTLEQLADEVGYSDTKNDWSEIAVDNDLREEDYNLSGGNKLKISFMTDTSELRVDSVVEGVYGVNLYGRDLCRALTFENNDFKVLEYEDNIIQQTEILVGLVKGSVPEFPNDGIDKGILGSNINSIQYPIILRQQAAVFEKDDRYKSISINKFERVGESLDIEFEIETRLGDKIIQPL